MQFYTLSTWSLSLCLSFVFLFLFSMFLVCFTFKSKCDRMTTWNVIILNWNGIFIHYLYAFLCLLLIAYLVFWYQPLHTYTCCTVRHKRHKEVGMTREMCFAYFTSFIRSTVSKYKCYMQKSWSIRHIWFNKFQNFKIPSTLQSVKECSRR